MAPKSKKYTNTDIKNAILRVLQDEWTVYKAAKKYGIPWSTLNHRLQNIESSKSIETCKVGRPFNLKKEEELKIISYIKKMQSIGFRLSATRIRRYAFKISKYKDKNHFSKTKTIAGWDWWTSFKNRHGFSIKYKYENPTLDSTKKALDEFYNKLCTTVDKYDLRNRPERWWNLDETVFNFVTESPEDLETAKKRKERIENEYVSVYLTINAVGQRGPCAVIFNEENTKNNKNDIPPGCYVTSDDGERDVFYNFLKYFTSKIGKERPIMIIMDYEKINVSPDSINFVETNEIILVTIPPHTKNILCPLRSVLEPIKESWRHNILNHIQNTNSEPDQSDFMKLFTPALAEAANDDNILNGFRKTGIWPINPDAIIVDTGDIIVVSEIHEESDEEGNTANKLIAKIHPIQRKRKARVFDLNNSDCPSTVKCIFENLKKLNKQNQQKAIKFIERQLDSVKKFIYLCRKNKLYTKSKVKIVQKNSCLIQKQSNGPFKKSKSDVSQNFSDNIETLNVDIEYKNADLNDFEDKCDDETSALPMDSLLIDELSNNSLLPGLEEKFDEANDQDYEKQWRKETKFGNDTKKLKNFCVICKKKFKSRHSLIKHIFKHPGTPQSCIKCRTAFNNAMVFKYHIVDNVCSVDFKQIFEIFKRSFAEKNFYCPYCGNRYAKTFNLRRHLEICDFLSGTFCNICKSHFNNEAEYEKHYSKHEKNKCTKCDTIFSSRVLLRKHHNLTHRIKKSPTKYSCNTCDIVFKNRSLYREHMKTFKNDEKHMETKEIAKASSDKIWCKICVKSFVDVKTYKRHCSRQNHLKMIKEDVQIKSFICEICGLVLKNNEGLTSHMNEMHKNKTRIMCEICPYSTVKTSNMARHKQIVHKQGPKNFACDKCPMLFNTSQVLKNHIAAIHCLEKPFSCDQCSKTFKLSTQLKRHSVVHNPVWAYLCNFCTTGFRRYSQLQKHIASKHDEQITNSLDPNGIQDPEILKRKRMKTVQTSTETTNTQEEEMFSMIDVQSGELVLMSVKDMSKNNVINMTTEGDLLNSVHIPDLWTNTDPGLYSIDPILQDNRNLEPTFMIPDNSQNHQLDDVSKNMIPEYTVNFVQSDGKNLEMLPDGFTMVKENMLPQDNLNPQIIVTNQQYGGCVDYCTIVMDQ